MTSANRPTTRLTGFRRAIPYSMRKLKNPHRIDDSPYSSLPLAWAWCSVRTLHGDLPLPEAPTYTSVSNTFAFFSQQTLQQEALGFVIWQNARVLLLALILSVFSLGVAAFIIPPVVYAILGYLLGQLLLAGYDLSAVFSGDCPTWHCGNSDDCPLRQPLCSGWAASQRGPPKTDDRRTGMDDGIRLIPSKIALGVHPADADCPLGLLEAYVTPLVIRPGCAVRM